MHDVRTQRDMIFTQRILQLDCAASRRDGVPRNERGSARFEKAERDQALPQRRLKIRVAIRGAHRHERAPIGRGDFVDAMDAHDFLDQIDFAFQVRAVARNLPRGGVVSFLDHAQAEALQAAIHVGARNGNAEQAIAAIVAQPNIGGRSRDFSRDRGFARWFSSGQFGDQLRRSRRGPQGHRGIDSALEAIAGVARQIQDARRAADARGQEVGSSRAERAASSPSRRFPRRPLRRRCRRRGLRRLP